MEKSPNNWTRATEVEVGKIKDKPMATIQREYTAKCMAISCGLCSSPARGESRTRECSRHCKIRLVAKVIGFVTIHSPLTF